MLEEIGCQVVASVPRLFKAAFPCQPRSISISAVLDINLAGGRSSTPWPFRLADRGIPFVFSTGYSTATLPPELRDRPLVKKPVDARQPEEGGGHGPGPG